MAGLTLRGGLGLVVLSELTDPVDEYILGELQETAPFCELGN